MELRDDGRTLDVQVTPRSNPWSLCLLRCLCLAFYRLSHFLSSDANTDFDPIDLDLHVTPANVADAMSQGEHMQALLLALRLNEKPLLRRVYESVPVERIAVMAANLPRVYVSNMYGTCLLLNYKLPCAVTDMCCAGWRLSPRRLPPRPTLSSTCAGPLRFCRIMPRGFRCGPVAPDCCNHVYWVLQDPSGRQACSGSLRSVQKSLFDSIGELSRLSDSNLHTLRYLVCVFACCHCRPFCSLRSRRCRAEGLTAFQTNRLLRYRVISLIFLAISLLRLPRQSGCGLKTVSRHPRAARLSLISARILAGTLFIALHSSDRSVQSMCLVNILFFQHPEAPLTIVVMCSVPLI
jgi:hypothetical protein